LKKAVEKAVEIRPLEKSIEKVVEKRPSNKRPSKKGRRKSPLK
jgi:hypothetical protein